MNSFNFIVFSTSTCGEKSDKLLKELNKIVVISNKDKIIKITSLEKVRLELKKNNTNLKCSKNSIMRLLEDNNIKLLTKNPKNSVERNLMP
ncbi:hypothetical protein [Spiroplasma ixodetis]|uniref:hypothetical protein n=1 Tax=Spiroplasma ixodetis TaxID=2141 RepID=UPI002578799B|nr:hypothetical protein [Spiroplasma ixodetis]